MEQNQILEYKGNKITFALENGDVMVNLTNIAKSFPDKNLSAIMNSLEMTEYINKLAEIKNCSSADLLLVRKGGSDINKQGTWANQKIALRVAQKMSAEFAILVDCKIEELLTQGYTKLDTISRKDLAKMLLESEEEKERLSTKAKALEVQNQIKEQVIINQNHTIREQAPKVEYHDRVLQSHSLIATTVIAKELGMSAVALNRKLKSMGVIYQVNDSYALYSKYQDKGYSAYRTVHFLDMNGIEHTSRTLYWTESGRKFILSVLRPEMKVA